MMKVLKLVSGLIILMAVSVVISLYWLSGNLNDLVKSMIEEVGSKTLQTTVTLEAVDIQLREGRARLTGLKIANPQEFTQPYVFTMDTVAVDLTLEKLLNQLVDITAITVDGARIVAEQKGLSTNLQVLKKNLGAAAAKSPQATPSDKSAPADVLIKIGLLRFSNSSAQLVSDQWGDREINAPNIELKNLGGESGIAPEEMATAILKPLIKKLNRSLEDSLKELLEEKLKETAKAKLKEKETELKQQLEGKLEEKLGSDSAETIDTLKSIFKR
jgi:hypothetical protein